MVKFASVKCNYGADLFGHVICTVATPVPNTRSPNQPTNQYVPLLLEICVRILTGEAFLPIYIAHCLGIKVHSGDPA